MSPEEVKELLLQNIEADEVTVESDGSHYNIVVVSSQFESLSPVKKQQLVYAVLNEKIADGSIHAVNMKTLTPAEWQQH